MTSFPDPVQSTALVPYDPTLPHISVKAHLEASADSAVAHALEVAKFESRHLAIEGRLAYLVQNLPKMLPFPFSGIIALQAGNGTIIQACHCPNQPEFTTDQTFNALSVGKLFTATAIMQLIEDGKFSLDTPLSELLTSDELDVPLRPPYLAEKPDQQSFQSLREHASGITVRHLLTHTAGFTHRPGSEEKGVAEGNNWDQAQFGKRCYSNYGYQLLGRIIGKHTDSGNMLIIDHEMRFRSHIEERIFKPAGMEGALRESSRLVDGVYPPARNQPDCFKIPKKGPKEPVKVVDTIEPYPHGNGCWRMSAQDLLAFGQAMHQHNRLLKEGSFNDMKEQHLGFMVNHENDDPREPIIGYGHPGGGPGMSAFIHTWLTEPPITAVVLSNYSGCADVKPFIDSTIH